METLAALNDRYMRQKGVAPPFRTQRIRFARIRTAPSGGREFVLPSLFGNRGDYIVPWGYLPEVTVLCVHDRMLWEALANTHGTLTPAMVRARAREVAASGILGATKGEVAASEIRAEAGRRHVLHARLLAELLGQIDADAAAALSAGTGPVLKPDQMQMMLVVAAAPLHLEPAVLFERAGEVAEIMAGTGFGDGGHPADRLRRLHEAIGSFAESVDLFGMDEPNESRSPANIVVQVADATYDRLGRLIEAIDADLRDLRRVLATSEGRAALHAKAAEADWIAEGWDLALSAWNAVELETRLQRRELAAMLSQILPSMSGEAVHRGQLPRGLTELAARDILGAIATDPRRRAPSRAVRGAA